MLEILRRNATGFLAKIMIGLLVLSFVFWGVADWVGGAGEAALATVGKTKISADTFQRSYRNELNAMSRQTGQQITPDQARLFKLDRLALNRLMNSTAMTNHARSLGLSLSDSVLVDGIRTDPDFQGIGGTFSRSDFDGLLQRAGLSEQAFLELRREDELREQLMGTINAAVSPPRPLIDTVHAQREETRVIEHLTIDASKAEAVPEPDEATLRAEYDAANASYMTPEYRKVAVLIAGLDQVRDRVPISDDEIKQAYEQDQDAYDTLEQRRIQQITFADKTAAELAKKTLGEGGKGFTEIAKDQGASLTDIDLGLMTRKQLIDPKIAEAAFSLERDKISDIIEGRFGPVLLRVSEIKPGKKSTLEEVKDRVRDKLFRERARIELQSVHDLVDNDRAAGKTLKEIGESHALKFAEVDATDNTNKTPDGKTAIEGGDAGIVEAAFKADVGIEQEAIDLTDNGFAWVDVLGITPPQKKPFDAVKDEVKTVYLDSKRSRALADLGDKLAERANAGETFDALSKDFGGKPEVTLPVTRSTVPQGLSQDAVAQAFGLAKGRAAATASADNKSRTLIKVTDIKPAAAPTQEQVDRLTTELRGQMQNDAIALYVSALRAQQGEQVDEAAFRRLTGVEAP